MCYFYAVSCLDVRQLRRVLREDSFSLVIDKALLDSLLCDDAGPAAALKLIEDVYRILKPGGTYVIVSHGAPATRMPLFTASPECKWTTQQRVLSECAMWCSRLMAVCLGAAVCMARVWLLLCCWCPAALAF